VLEGNAALLAMAAETVTTASLDDFRNLADGPPVLVLAAGRASHLGRRSTATPDRLVAFALPECLSAPALRGLADPTLPQLVQQLPQAMRYPPLSDSAVTLAKGAGLLPALLVSELSQQRAGDARQDGCLVVPVEKVIPHLAQRPTMVRLAEARLPISTAPDARVIVYRNLNDGLETVAVVVGDLRTAEAPVVRVHSACFTGDLLGSLRCDCGPQLQQALEIIAAEGAGILLYLPQEGRGIGLANKLRSYVLQDLGLDTLEANHALGWESDARSFEAASVILKDLGSTRIRLLSNNPEKVSSLARFGIQVQSRLGHTIPPNGTNDRYLETKRTCCGHFND
jgi:GTP cyclohydrolase II